MPQAFSGGFNSENNPLPRIMPHICREDPRCEKDHKFRDAVYLLDKLKESGSKYKIHYFPSSNPFDEHFRHFNEMDITQAIADCNDMIPLRADYGEAIKGVIPDIVRKCYLAGYAVNAPETVNAMYGAAVALCSVEYQTQLGQHQASYGTLDSSKTSVPYSPAKK
jgi:hypothetical protein